MSLISKFINAIRLQKKEVDKDKLDAISVLHPISVIVESSIKKYKLVFVEGHEEFPPVAGP